MSNRKARTTAYRKVYYLALGLRALLLFSTATALAQDSWLPPRVAEGLAAQVAERMQAVDPAAEPEQLLSGGRRLIALLETQLESWGEAEVLAQAPMFPKLALPRSPQPHLDAINRYQLCNLILEIQQSVDKPMDARRAGVIASTAVTSAVVYLRAPYLQAGGDLAEVERFLTSPSMEQIFDAVQNEEEFAAHVAEQCTPVVSALLQP